MQYHTIAALPVTLATSPSLLAYPSLHQPLTAHSLSNTDHTVGISARELVDALLGELQARANDNPLPPPQPRPRQPGVAPELQMLDAWQASRQQNPAITAADQARLAEIERQRQQMEQQRGQMEEERRHREQQQRQGQ